VYTMWNDLLLAIQVGHETRTKTRRSTARQGKLKRSMTLRAWVLCALPAPSSPAVLRAVNVVACLRVQQEWVAQRPTVAQQLWQIYCVVLRYIGTEVIT
jgi:hypothetical protein